MSNEVVACKPFVRRARAEDIPFLAENIREDDRLEIWHGYRVTPEEAFQTGYDVSDTPYTVEWKGNPVAMFGVSGVEGVGVPWMLATDDLKKIRKSFLKECRSYVEELNNEYPLLVNQVWAKNTTHIQWLKWLDFQFDIPVEMGPDNEMFIRFYKEA
jgi:hypothetical protein